MSRVIGGNRVRTAAALTACAALLGGLVATPAQAGPAGGDGPGAAAAKKKGKKKKKKKCNSPKRSRVHNALTCTALTRTISNSPPAPAGTETYAFCRNGTYTYRKTNYREDGNYFTTTYNGRWRATSSFGTSAGLTGTIQYSVTNFVSVTGTGAPAEPPPPALLSQGISFGPFGVTFAGSTYLYGRAGC